MTLRVSGNFWAATPIYILDLISSYRAFSLSISDSLAGQLMPRPSCSLGLGIYKTVVSKGFLEDGKEGHPDEMNIPCGSGPAIHCLVSCLI